MRDLAVLFLHLLTTIARLAGPAARGRWSLNQCSSSTNC